MRLHPALWRTLMLRGVVAWAIARALAVVVLEVQAQSVGTDGVDPASVAVVTWVVGFAAALVFVDLRRRKELILLRNLGLSATGAVGVALVPTLLVEVTWLVL